MLYLYLQCEKRTKKKQKEAGFGPFLKKAFPVSILPVLQANYECNLPLWMQDTDKGTHTYVSLHTHVPCVRL